MPVRSEFAVRRILHIPDGHGVQHGVLLPEAAALVKDHGVRVVGIPSNICVLPDDFFGAVLVLSRGLHFNCLDVMLQLPLHTVAEALRNTAFVLVERLVDGDVGRGQACVALRHDMMAAEHASQ